MRKLDYTDIIGGTLLVALGLFVGFYAANQYDIGTAARMGAGYFPTVLGFLLAALGLAVTLPALARRGEMPRPHWRPLATILLALLAFALTVRMLGVVPATVLLTVLAAAAQPGVRFVPTLVLAGGLSVLAVLVFLQGLGVVLPAFRWPG